MIQREQAEAEIRASKVSQFADEMVALLEPSIRIGVEKAEPVELKPGESRFGGCPDVLPGFQWPAFDARPMAHIAQLDLAEVARHDVAGLLPKSGWLCFFFDVANEAPFAPRPGDVHPWKVVYFDGDRADVAWTPPPEDAARGSIFRLCSVGMATELTLPSFRSSLLVDLPLDEEMQDDYDELVLSLLEHAPIPHDPHGVGKLVGKVRQWLLGDPIHRMLGHPQHFHVDPRVDWQRILEHRTLGTTPDNKTQHEAQDWLLLLQVDNYKEGPDWLWGDNVTLYYGIRRADLTARNFDAVEWTVECG